MTKKDQININSIKKVHFTGIGGIGVSALAKMFLMRGGIEVCGSDRDPSGVAEELARKGAKVCIGHSRANVGDDIDLFVYTPAISEDNPELEKARELGVPILNYPELLGVFSRAYRTVAVAGTHGKTTTTGMMATAMHDLGMSPTVVIGGLMQETKSNFIAGGSDYLVVEACEYKRAFLNLTPEVLIITNIEEDHLDYYDGIEDIKSAFRELVERVPDYGCIVTDGSNEKVAPVLASARAKVLNYNKLTSETKFLKDKGDHNVLNGAAVLSACRDFFGLPAGKIKQALLDFKGTSRRCEYKGSMIDGEVEVYDDYAHHPTEIKTTLSALKRSFPNKKIVVVFQPHLFSRTKRFLKEYGGSFADADEIIVTPIYAAREKDEGIVSSGDLVRELTNKGNMAHRAYDLEEAVDMAKEKSEGCESVIMTMGAGDVFKVAGRLLEE